MKILTFIIYPLILFFLAFVALPTVFAQTFKPIPVGGCPSGYTENEGGCKYTGGGTGSFGPIPVGGCPPYYAKDGNSSCQFKGLSFGPVPASGCPANYKDNKNGACDSVFDSSSIIVSPSQCSGFTDCLYGITSPTGPTEGFDRSGRGLVGDLISRIIPIAIGFGGMLTVVFIIISGIQFVTSGGDPKGAAAAKDRLVYAVIGFVVLILAYAILQIIDKLFLNSGIV